MPRPWAVSTGDGDGASAPRAGAHSLLGGILLLLALCGSALALSELREEHVEPPADLGDTIEREPLTPLDLTVPLPDPITPPPPREDTRFDEPADMLDPQDPPEIVYDVERLPEPARRMRQRLMEAALTGDIERLRPLMDRGEDATLVSLGGYPDDPISYLRELSGDAAGQEILAILYEVLEAGFVHLDAGSAEEIFVWPYFYAVPLDTLDPRQRVELFKLVTAGDYEEMKAFGGYLFYRAGITPEGRWAFFLAGH